MTKLFNIFICIFAITAFCFCMYVLISNLIRSTEAHYQYNAYSPLYDEYFILNSEKPLVELDTVYWNDNVEYDPAGKYTAIIQGPYNSIQ